MSLAEDSSLHPLPCMRYKGSHPSTVPDCHVWPATTSDRQPSFTISLHRALAPGLPKVALSFVTLRSIGVGSSAVLMLWPWLRVPMAPTSGHRPDSHCWWELSRHVTRCRVPKSWKRFRDGAGFPISRHHPLSSATSEDTA